jgi:glycosyltransferase involved in cell wall biosynthesis
MRQCRTCDVGLSLLPSASADLNERAMVGASNKVFEYLASGLAVLVGDLPRWRETFVDAGFGRACDPASSASIAAELRWLLDHPGERIAMGERGRQRIGLDWNYDHQFAPVLARMI